MPDTRELSGMAQYKTIKIQDIDSFLFSFKEGKHNVAILNVYIMSVFAIKKN